MNNISQFGVFKKAAKLAKDPSNGCRVVLSERHFALSPRFLGRLKKGVMEILESEIGRYSESLHGVPLAYCNLQLLQPAGTILDDQPFIHFNVSFRAVVFQPAIGSILKCKINEFASDHISCLVHDWFNLSLPLLDPDLEQRLPRGSKVMAAVTNIQEKNGILAIQGTPTGDRFPGSAIRNAVVPKLEPVDEEQAQQHQGLEHTARKQKHDSGFISDPDTSLEGETSVSHTPHESRRKKKKEKEIKVEITSDDEQRTDNFDRGSTSSSVLPVLDSVHEPEVDRGEKIKHPAIKIEPVTDDEMTENDNILRGEKRIMEEDQSASDRLQHFAGGDSNNGDSLEFVKKQHKKKKKRKHTELVGVAGDMGLKKVKTEVDLDEENAPMFESSSKKKKRKERVSVPSTSDETLDGKRVDDDIDADIQRMDSRRSKKQNGSTCRVFESTGGILHVRTEIMSSDHDLGKHLHTAREHTHSTSLGKGGIVENEDKTKRTKQGEISDYAGSRDGGLTKKRKKKKIKREGKEVALD